ncbi:MAG TPA: hypothetical protein VMK12_22245 [Anaeromyxobacteraceae bacterium]|nr:hypothetical protein [Anaeromyxobacteraceae bacterium]
MSSTQTFAGWPLRVWQFSEIPAAFRLSFADLTRGEGPFPLVLFSPEFKSPGHYETPKLLVISGDHVICFEHRRDRVEKAELLLSDVHTVECGSVLLRSWLRLEASSSAGDCSIEVSFNRVCRELYWDVVEDYRTRLYRGSQVPLDCEQAKFNVWVTSDFAFMYLAKSALVPGAEARDFFLQRQSPPAGSASCGTPWRPGRSRS